MAVAAPLLRKPAFSSVGPRPARRLDPASVGPIRSCPRVSVRSSAFPVRASVFNLPSILVCCPSASPCRGSLPFGSHVLAHRVLHHTVVLRSSPPRPSLVAAQRGACRCNRPVPDSFRRHVQRRCNPTASAGDFSRRVQRGRPQQLLAVGRHSEGLSSWPARLAVSTSPGSRVRSRAGRRRYARAPRRARRPSGSPGAPRRCRVAGCASMPSCRLIASCCRAFTV